MTPARVRACSRLASRARKPGASDSWRSNTLRSTMRIVSIVGASDWAGRRSGGRALSKPSTMPTARPPLRPTALLDQVNALVQRIGGVAGGIVPFRKIQRRVPPARDLAQAPRGEAERAPRRVGFERVAEAGGGGIRGNAGVRGSERVRHVLSQIPRAPEVERQRQRVLVALAFGGIEVVAGEPDITTAVPRVDREPGEGELGILGGGDAAVPFPARGRLDPEGVVEARGGVAGGDHEQQRHGEALDRKSGVEGKSVDLGG